MNSKWVLLAPAAGTAAMLLAACATDVPAPEDPQGQEWTSRVKSSYSGWQPPREMPKGNPGYEAAFNKKTVSGKTASAVSSDKMFADPVVPALDVIRIEALEGSSENYIVNGELLQGQEVDLYLRDLAAANKSARVMISAPSTVPAKQVSDFADSCRKIGFSNVSVVSVPAPMKAAASGKTAVKKASVSHGASMVVDRSQPAATYTVVSGDSLSRIAQKQYKNGNLWYILFRENKAALKDKANNLRPGMKLTVPALKPAGAASK